MSVALVGSAGNASSTTSPVTGSFGQAPTAGNLLVAVFTWATTAATTFAPTQSAAGWSRLISAAVGNNSAGTSYCGIDVWAKTAAGSDAAPVFTQSSGTTAALDCVIFELSGADNASPLDTQGIQQSGSSSTTLTFSVTTAGSIAAAGEFAISAMIQKRTVSAALTWTESGTGWTSGYTDATTSRDFHTQVNYQANPSSGATLADSGHWSTNSSAYGAAVVLAINAAAGGTPATATGSLGITGSAAAQAPAAASGSLAIAGTAAARAPAGASGAITLTGAGPAAAAVSASGALGITGTAAAPAAAAASGALSLAGTAAAQAPATATGALDITGTVITPQTLTNTAEGGTSGTTVSAANSGGASGNAFDVVTIGAGATLIFDNAQSAHGSLSYKFATGATAVDVDAQWTISLGSSLPKVWFRVYAYFTALPAVTTPIALLRSGTALASRISVNSAGTIIMSNSTASTTVISSTGTIPAGQWFRVEGFVAGDAAAGQVEFKLFGTSMDAATPDETQTSAATQNTTGLLSRIDFGNSGAAIATMGPYWLDDLGASDAGYIGPAGGGAAPATATGALGIAGTAAGQAPAAPAGTLGITGTAAAAPGGGASGSLTLAGTSAAAAAASAAGRLPSRVTGGYWPYYLADGGPLPLSQVDPGFNVIYLFSARPVGGSPGTDGSCFFDQQHETTAQLITDIAAIRASGRLVLMSVGGAGEFIDLSTTARRDAFLSSFKSVVDGLGGLDGIDWDFELTSGSYDTDSMIYISQQLRSYYGPQFCVTYPPAPWSTPDKALASALLAAGVLDFVAPQYYDLTGLTDDASQIANLLSRTGEWVALTGDASKVGLGFKNIPANDPSTMEVASCVTAWDDAVATYPALRGGYIWNVCLDEFSNSGQFAAVVNPVILALATPAGLEITGTAAAKAPATASGSLSLSGTASAAAPAAASGALGITGTAAAAVPGANAAGVLSLAGTSAAKAPAAGAGALALSGTAAARAPASAAGSLSLAGAAATAAGPVAGSLALAGTAAARAPVSAAGSLALAGTAVTQAPPGAGVIALSGTAAARAPAASAGALTLAGAAAVAAPVTAAGSMAFSGTAAASGPGTTAAGALALAGTAAGAAPAAATGAVALAGAAGAAAQAPSPAGTVALTGGATARAPTAAAGVLSLAGTAEFTPPFTVGALTTADAPGGVLTAAAGPVT